MREPVLESKRGEATPRLTNWNEIKTRVRGKRGYTQMRERELTWRKL